MRASAVAVPLVLCFARPHSAVAQQLYRVSWWDAASIAVAGGLAAIPTVAGLPSGPPPCAPCDPATLSDFDRVALNTFSSSAATTSNFLLIGVTAGSAAALLEGADPKRARGDAVVVGDALTWTLAATQGVKVAGPRRAPALYTAGAPPAAADPQ